MIPAWWRRRLRNGTESAELSLPPRDQLCHEIRNALAGIQYERKQIAKSLITIQTHMARIEAALR